MLVVIAPNFSPFSCWISSKTPIPALVKRWVSLFPEGLACFLLGIDPRDTDVFQHEVR